MVRPLKHTQVSTCLVHPRCGSLLPSTVHNALALVNIVHVHASGHALSISAKPGSATYFPTSTTSTGLQHLSVGPCVHLVWLRAANCHIWPLPCINIFHASQLWASLGGHQLELHSPEREHKFTSVATRVFKKSQNSPGVCPL